MTTTTDTRLFRVNASPSFCDADKIIESNPGDEYADIRRWVADAKPGEGLDLYHSKVECMLFKSDERFFAADFTEGELWTLADLESSLDDLGRTRSDEMTWARNACPGDVFNESLLCVGIPEPIDCPPLPLDAGKSLTDDQRLERRIVANAIRYLDFNGFKFRYIWDGEEPMRDGRLFEQVDTIFNVEDALLYVRRDADGAKSRSIRFVIGNAPDEVIADHAAPRDTSDGFVRYMDILQHVIESGHFAFAPQVQPLDPRPLYVVTSAAGSIVPWVGRADNPLHAAFLARETDSQRPERETARLALGVGRLLRFEQLTPTQWRSGDSERLYAVHQAPEGFEIEGLASYQDEMRRIGLLPIAGLFRVAYSPA